ncbi:MAG: HD domain-containing protein [Halanaerobiales bacterium]|nr:HD domain-containing protein [Halanaerobiales bacterium]
MDFNIKEEIKIILIYILLGIMWIYFSDKILVNLFADESMITTIQTYKGIIYVLFTGLIFYLLLKKYFNQLRETKRELKRKNKKLNIYTHQLKKGNEVLKDSYQTLYEQTEDLKIMIDFINNINRDTFTDVDNFLSLLLRTAHELVPKCDYGSVYRISEEKVKYIDAIGHNLKMLKRLDLNKEVFNIHKQKPKIINNLLSKENNELSSNHYEKLKEASKNIRQSLTFSLVVDDQMLAGISLDIAENNNSNFNEDDIETLEAFRNLAESFYIFQRYNKLQGEFQRDIILSMIKFLEIHDKYTGGHSEEVAELSREIAKKMNLHQKEVQYAYWTGLVHDIGKLIIPRVTLNKKEEITEKEYNLIKKHPLWAYESLSESKRLNEIAEFVLYHHEKWDGNGYPEGLKAEEIPLISRIISIADAYSAMTSDRAYRDALSKDEAMKELRKNSGKQFDPEIVDIFLEIIESMDRVI